MCARVQARVVGYVEQSDVHSAGLTVEESLRFSAALRLTSDVASDTRAAYVLEVLVITELLDIRGNIVGSSGMSGLSVEQRRRLSIGVELVSNPSVVVRIACIAVLALLCLHCCAMLLALCATVGSLQSLGLVRGRVHRTARRSWCTCKGNCTSQS